VAHNVFGVAQTINSANFIYFEALQRTLKLGHPDAVNIYTTQLVELHLGQGKDIYWRDSHSCPSEPEYMQMVREKTGGLFMLGIALMQLFSENKTDFTPLVEMLGLYFQIRDDYANLSSEEYAENKSFCEDLTEGKYSFPIIHGIRETSFSSQLKSIPPSTDPTSLYTGKPQNKGHLVNPSKMSFSQRCPLFGSFVFD
jgi:geranylgeranyl diphosphate synthase type 3